MRKGKLLTYALYGAVGYAAVAFLWNSRVVSAAMLKGGPVPNALPFPFPWSARLKNVSAASSLQPVTTTVSRIS